MFMPERKAQAVWQRGLKDGEGSVKLGSGVFEGPYSFKTRFEETPGTNPEELIAAAHAGCFSMALAAGLEKAGHKPERVETTATVHLAREGEGFRISRIDLHTTARIPGLDEMVFREQADNAKSNCPVSKALAAVPIHLDARLVK
jgi:osmotically inducible protein OsmC